jgi:hypothetical protein
VRPELIVHHSPGLDEPLRFRQAGKVVLAQALHKKNQEQLAKKRAMRERMAAAKKERKQPGEAPAEPTAAQTPERAPETPSKAPEAPEAQKRESLNALKARVKEAWPKAKHMADAKRDELDARLERGDAERFTQHQETWPRVRRSAARPGSKATARAPRSPEPSRSKRPDSQRARLLKAKKPMSPAETMLGSLGLIAMPRYS